MFRGPISMSEFHPQENSMLTLNAPPIYVTYNNFIKCIQLLQRNFNYPLKKIFVFSFFFFFYVFFNSKKSLEEIKKNRERILQNIAPFNFREMIRNRLQIKSIISSFDYPIILV